MEPSGEERLHDLDAEYGKYHDVSDDDECAGTLLEHRRRILARINAAESPKRRTWLY